MWGAPREWNSRPDQCMDPAVWGMCDISLISLYHRLVLQSLLWDTLWPNIYSKDDNATRWILSRQVYLIILAFIGLTFPSAKLHNVMMWLCTVRIVKDSLDCLFFQSSSLKCYHQNIKIIWNSCCSVNLVWRIYALGDESRKRSYFKWLEKQRRFLRLFVPDVA